MLGAAGVTPGQHCRLPSLPRSPCLELAHLLQQLRAEGGPGGGLGGAAWVSPAKLRSLGLGSGRVQPGMTPFQLSKEKKSWGRVKPRRPFPLQIPPSIKLYLVSAVDSASILLVIQGTAVGTSTAAASEMTLRRGSVLFISANESISLHLSSPDGMLLFRACCLL